MARKNARVLKTQRVKTASKSKLLLFTLFLVSAVLVVMLIFSPSPVVEDKHISLIQKNDEFYGRLLKDIKTSGMGTVKADLDCKGPPTSITCRAVVQMDSGETVEFNYTHDMTSQSCLSLGDRVLIEILEGNSTVRVVRLSETN